MKRRANRKKRRRGGRLLLIGGKRVSKNRKKGGRGLPLRKGVLSTLERAKGEDGREGKSYIHFKEEKKKSRPSPIS